MWIVITHIAPSSLLHQYMSCVCPPRLTRDVGLPLAELPLEPQHGRILLASSQCGEEAVTLVALLSGPHLWTASRGAHKAQV